MRQFNRRYWPYQINVRPEERKLLTEDMERYCYDNFKTSDWRNDGRYFVFKREQDLTLFSLRWL